MASTTAKQGNQYWEVVGGVEGEGLKVRKDKAVSSKQLTARLANGSVVKELALDGTRLYYTLVEGKGPERGWVSVKLKDKDLLVPKRAVGEAARARSPLAPLAVPEAPVTAAQERTSAERQAEPAGPQGHGQAAAAAAVAGPKGTPPEVAAEAAPEAAGAAPQGGAGAAEGPREGGHVSGSEQVAAPGGAEPAPVAAEKEAETEVQALTVETANRLDGGASQDADVRLVAAEAAGRESALPCARDERGSAGGDADGLSAELSALHERLRWRNQQLEDLDGRLSDLARTEVDGHAFQAQLEQLAQWAANEARTVEVSSAAETQEACPGAAPGDPAPGPRRQLDPDSDRLAEVEASHRFAEALRVSWPHVLDGAETYRVDVWPRSRPGWTLAGLTRPDASLAVPAGASVLLRVAVVPDACPSGPPRLLGPWTEVSTRPLDLSLPGIHVDPFGLSRGSCAKSGCEGYVSMASQEPGAEGARLALCARCGLAADEHAICTDESRVAVEVEAAGGTGTADAGAAAGAARPAPGGAASPEAAAGAPQPAPEGALEELAGAMEGEPPDASEPPNHAWPEECRALRRILGGLLGRACLDSLYRSLAGRTADRPRVRGFRNVSVYRTRKGVASERLQKVDFHILGAIRSNSQEPSVFVDPSRTFPRPWLGFGGSFTEAAAVALSKMTPRQQEDVVRSYFASDGNMRYTLCRVHIGSCDFCTSTWTCGKLPDNDRELRGFSLARYREAILPLIKRAAEQAGRPLTLLASPWSPLYWMKTNRAACLGGSLRSDCRDVWALHFVRFIQGMADAGVPIWGVTVQNEAEADQDWESCIYTAEQERDFVRDFLGPALEKAGLGSVKILVWDHNRDGMLERAAIAYDDPEAAKYIWGVGYHWYGDARFETWPACCKVGFDDRNTGGRVTELRSRLCSENVRRVVDLRPDKHVIQTESCQEARGKSISSWLGEWKIGERYAMNIIADMNSGCEGWIDWNLVLDGNGGPNHCQNFCLAPIMCDARAGEVRYEPAYWYIAQFARFIHPGALRVACSSSYDAMEVTAFKNLDGSVAVVVLNQSAESIYSVCLKILGSGSILTNVPSRSITTFVVT